MVAPLGGRRCPLGGRRCPPGIESGPGMPSRVALGEGEGKSSGEMVPLWSVWRGLGSPSGVTGGGRWRLPSAAPRGVAAPRGGPQGRLGSRWDDPSAVGVSRAMWLPQANGGQVVVALRGDFAHSGPRCPLVALSRRGLMEVALSRSAAGHLPRPMVCGRGRGQVADAGREAGGTVL